MEITDSEPLPATNTDFSWIWTHDPLRKSCIVTINPWPFVVVKPKAYPPTTNDSPDNRPDMALHAVSYSILTLNRTGVKRDLSQERVTL